LPPHAQGTEILLRNFVFGICGAKPTWTPQHFIDATIAQVRHQVGSGRGALRAFRGVGSSVAAVLWIGHCATRRASLA